MKFNTKTIHGGQHHEKTTGAVMTPIFQTSTFAQTSPGKPIGDFEYSRGANPTRTALENSLACLENGTKGLAFASGLAATDAIMKILKTGDEVIATDNIYGGTYRMFTKVYQDFGIKFHFVDMTELDKLESLINNNTKLIWLETPTNPLMKVADIAEVSKITKKHKLLLAVDNTFATPYLQKPLDLGADIVLHSLTKYAAGHSDVVMGALVTNNEDLAERLAFIQNASGAVPGPQDCFLVLRGLKTLHVRMDRHCDNAQAIVTYLKQHPLVAQVNYPGLEEHEGHAIAKRQMRNFGGMVSFKLKEDQLEQAFKFVSATRLFALAESLGGVESLIGHPATMTHASIPKELRALYGISDGLIRLSVGIEAVEDLIADLEQAFQTISTH